MFGHSKKAPQPSTSSAKLAGLWYRNGNSVSSEATQFVNTSRVVKMHRRPAGSPYANDKRRMVRVMKVSESVPSRAAHLAVGFFPSPPRTEMFQKRCSETEGRFTTVNHGPSRVDTVDRGKLLRDDLSTWRVCKKWQTTSELSNVMTALLFHEPGSCRTWQR